MIESRVDAAQYLFDFCQGYGERSSRIDEVLSRIRFLLKIHYDSDLFSHHCFAKNRTDGRSCMQSVKVSKLRCYHHRYSNHSQKIVVAENRNV